METLTVRVRPYPDEAISSYMFRLAKANGMSIFSLWKLVREKRTHYVQRADISIIDSAPVNVISAEKLARVALIDVDTVFQGSMYYVIDKFILGDRFERARFLSGMVRENVVYCPICLNEHPYNRLLWRINGIDICLKHKVQLVKKCQVCNRVIKYKDFSIMDECPYCHEKFSSLSPIEPVAQSDYLLQQDLQELWIQLLKPGALKLTPSEVALRILYLANQQNEILDRNRLKNNISNKNLLSTMLQQARGTLSDKRAIHIALVLKFLQFFRIDVNSFYGIKLPEIFVECIKLPLEEMKRQHACIAPWCRNFGKAGGLVKTGTSVKKKISGEKLHYYLACPECGCEYAVNEAGQLEERTYFIKGYSFLRELQSNEDNLKAIAKKSGLSEDKVRRCYAYFRTRALFSFGSNHSKGWVNKQIKIEEQLLNKVIEAAKAYKPLKDVAKWPMWESYDHFLTYRFHPEVVRAILLQMRRRSKRGLKINLESVQNLIGEFLKADIEISLKNVAQSLNVSPETLRSVGANPVIASARKDQRDRSLTTRTQNLLAQADAFFLQNQDKHITASQLYDFLGISRPVLWRTNPKLTNQLKNRIRQYKSAARMDKVGTFTTLR
jgi:predicted RNA-binding Zn-ribbon protein involved in translation (DUF1610 family)